MRPAAPRVGRAGRDAVADHRGGRQHRPLLAGLRRQRVRRPHRPHCSRSSARSWPGATPASRSRSSAPRSASSGIIGNGTPEQIGEWVPQCFGTPGSIHLAAFARERARRRLRRELAAQPRRLRRGQGRVGAQRHQDVDHQRRHRRRARGRRCRSSPSSGAAGTPASSCRRARPGSRMGQKFKKMGIRAVAHRRGHPRRLPRARALPARRQGEARRAPRPCPRGQERAGAGRDGTFEASRPAVGAQAVGIARAAYEYALEYAKERKQFGRAIIENQAIAFKLADMKMQHRRRPAARVARRLDGRRRQAVRSRRRLDVEALRGRERGVGHRAGDPDPRRLRLRARVPGRALAPRRQDLHDLRGHLARSSASSSPAPSPACTFSRSACRAPRPGVADGLARRVEGVGLARERAALR